MAVRLVSNFTLSTLGQLDSFGGFAQHLAGLASRMLHESKAIAGRQVLRGPAVDTVRRQGIYSLLYTKL